MNSTFFNVMSFSYSNFKTREVAICPLVPESRSDAVNLIDQGRPAFTGYCYGVKLLVFSKFMGLPTYLIMAMFLS